MDAVYRATLPLAAAAALLSGCAASVAESDQPQVAAAPSPPPMSVFCEAVTANVAAAQPLTQITGRGGGTPEEFAAVAEVARRSNAELVAAAPVEIRADIEAGIALATLQLELLATSNGNPAVITADSEIVTRAQDPEYLAGRERIAAFVAENCNVDINAPTG